MIIAVDFDGVLCENRFPDIGDPIQANIALVKRLVEDGHEVILWTSRVGDELLKAAIWCSEHGLKFCAVNDDAPSNRKQYEHVYDERPRKIYADVYIDDHSAGFDQVALAYDVFRMIWR